MSIIQRDIELLYEPMRLSVYSMLSHLRGHGLAVAPFETLRTAERQAEVLKEGRSLVRTSLHQFGLAIDIYPKDSSGFLGGKRLNDWPNWKDVGDSGIEHGFEWGGNFKHWVIIDGVKELIPFSDRPHFQMTFGMKKSTLDTLYFEHGLPGVWEFLDDWIKSKPKGEA